MMRATAGFFLIVAPAAALLLATTSPGSGQESPAPRGSEGASAPAVPGRERPQVPDAALRRARAEQLLLAGKADDAAAAYQDALGVDGGDDVAKEGRVRALVAAGRWPMALEEARRHATANPRSALLQSALGQALYRAGLLREASTCLSPLAAADATPARALMTLGLVRVAEGKEDEGAALLDRALALAPDARDVILESAGAAPTRAEAVARLNRYLERSAGDDPDRIDGAKGTIRIYQALGERKVWVRASQPARVELRLSSLRNTSGALAGFVVELGTARKPIRVLLDSGSTGLFLLERIAVKAGFTLLAEETTFGGGGEGRHATRTGLLPVAAIGDLRFTDALVRTTTQEIEPMGRYHGLLGLSIFRGYRVTIDLAKEKLILEAAHATTAAPRQTGPSAPAGTAPPPKDPSARAPGAAPGSPVAPAPQPSPTGAGPSHGDPYWTVSSQMLVEAATADGRRGLFLFDTGASTSLLSLDFADASPGASLSASTSVRGYGGALRDAHEVRGVRLLFQGLETTGASMTASDLGQRARLGGVEVSGYLGLDLLARTLVTVDTVHQRVTVTKPGKR